MNRPGFTIIELIVAASIVAMMVAVGLPRYIAFSRQQDFSAQTQAVVQCIRKGQGMATALGAPTPSSGTYRYVVTTLKSTVSGSLDGNYCLNTYLSGYSTSNPGTNFLAGIALDPDTIAHTLPSSILAGQPTSGTPTSTGTVSSVETWNPQTGTYVLFSAASSGTNFGFRIFFDGQAAGAPVAVTCDGVGANCTIGNSNVHGLPLKFQVIGSDTSLKGTILVGALGGVSYEE